MPMIKKKRYAAKDHQEQEFVTLANRIFDALSGYKKQLIAGASLLIGALVILAGYSLIRSQQERIAAPLVAAAYEYYSPAGEMPADYRKALGLFRDIQNRYSDTRSGAIAQYYIGNCLAGLGQADEALREYLIFTNTYSSEKLLSGLVYQRMGYLYRMLGKQAEAVRAFEQAEAVAGPGVSTIELARLYEASGNIQESQKKYKLAMDNLAGTSWGMEAMGKVQKIGSSPQPPAGKSGK